MPPRTWFDQNAPQSLAGLSDPNNPTLPYLPPTGGINPDGMYSGTEAPVQSGSAVSTPAPTATQIMQSAQGTVPPGGFNEAWFRQNIGAPGTPQELVALESKLAPYGIKVMRNASGVAGKIQLPSGEIVDVINSAGAGGRGFQWLTGPGTPAGAGYLSNFQTGTFTGGGQYPLAAVMGSGLMQPWTTPFQAPTDVTQQNDPGWQFRMQEGLKAIERSAAAKGTLLTGGTLKDLNAWAQNTASNEYDKVYGRALGEYQQAYGIFNNNQNNAYSRLYGLSSQGLQAAGGAGANNSGYMNTATGTIEGMGNVAGAGTMGAANAWANVPGQIAGTLGSLANYYATQPQAPAAPYTPYTGGDTVKNTLQPWQYGTYYPRG